MLRHLSIGLLASAVAIAPLPLKAQDGSADDLGVMSSALKMWSNLPLASRGALQGAGTPNQAGIGGFLPLSVGDNSVFLLMLSPKSTLLIARAIAASTPTWLDPPSAPQLD